MKILKRLLLALILLIAAALIWLLFFFDANQFKPEIEQAAYDQTGRKLKIHGDIDLALWPPVSLNISQVEFENGEGFGQQPMAKLGELQLVANLWALLDNRLEVSRLNISDVDLRLAKDSAGRSNWQDIGADKEGDKEGKKENSKDESAAAEADNEELGPETNSEEATQFNIAAISLSNVNLHYSDAQAKQQVSINGLNLETGAIKANTPVPLKLSLRVVNEEPQAEVNLSASGKALWEEETQRISLQQAALNISAVSGALPNGRLESAFSGDVVADLVQQSLTLKKAELELDDSKLNIGAQIFWAQQPLTVTAEISSDHIDLRPYLAESNTESSEPAAQTNDATETSEASENINETEIPTAWLEALNLDLLLKIAKITTPQADVNNLVVDAEIKNARAKWEPISLDIFQGSLTTTGRFSKQGLSLELLAANIDAAEVQKSTMGEAYADGKLNLQRVKLNTRGKTVGEWRKNLSGDGAMLVNDAAVHGMNVVAWVRDIQALLKGGELTNLGQNQENRNTDFAAITASFTIQNGVLDNQDLLAKSPGVRVKGYGQVDLANETLDYYMVPSVVETSQGQGGEERDDVKGVDVPRHCKGPWADLKCRFKVENAVKEKAKDKAKEKLNEKLQDKFGDKVPSGLLDGLFN